MYKPRTMSETYGVLKLSGLTDQEIFKKLKIKDTLKMAGVKAAAKRCNHLTGKLSKAKTEWAATQMSKKSIPTAMKVVDVPCGTLRIKSSAKVVVDKNRIVISY